MEIKLGKFPLKKSLKWELIWFPYPGSEVQNKPSRRALIWFHPLSLRNSSELFNCWKVFWIIIERNSSVNIFSLFESFDYLTFQFKSQEWSGQSVPTAQYPARSPEWTEPDLMLALPDSQPARHLNLTRSD